MLTSTMGISKTMISRLIDGLTQKGMILKKKSTTDKRSYSIVVTQKGKKEIDNAYQYYMEPIYRLQKEMGKEDLETLFSTIEQANEILHESTLSTFWEKNFEIEAVYENPFGKIWFETIPRIHI